MGRAGIRCERARRCAVYTAHLQRAEPIRRGISLVEISFVLTLLGILLGTTAPTLVQLVDRARVDAATREIARLYAGARFRAVYRGIFVTVTVDTIAGTVTVRDAGAAGESREIEQAHGVALRASRRVATFAPTGLGYGAANTSVIVRRGSVADTVVMSRLGRLRH